MHSAASSPSRAFGHEEILWEQEPSLEYDNDEQGYVPPDFPDTQDTLVDPAPPLSPVAPLPDLSVCDEEKIVDAISSAAEKHIVENRKQQEKAFTQEWARHSVEYKNNYTATLRSHENAAKRGIREVTTKVANIILPLRMESDKRLKRVQSLEEHMKEHEASLQARERELSSLHSRVRELENSQQAMGAKSSELENDLRTQEGFAKVLGKQLEDKEVMLKALEESNRALLQEKRHAEELLEASKMEVEKLVARFKLELDEQLGRYADLEARYDSKVSQEATLLLQKNLAEGKRDELLRAKQESAAALEQLGELQRERDALLLEKQESAGRVAKVYDELVEMTRKHGRAKELFTRVKESILEAAELCDEEL